MDTNDALSKSTIQSNGFVACVTQKKLSVWYREIKALVATKEMHECSFGFELNLKLNLVIKRYHNLLIQQLVALTSFLSLTMLKVFY